jgi:hypothetical protein
MLLLPCRWGCCCRCLLCGLFLLLLLLGSYAASFSVCSDEGWYAPALDLLHKAVAHCSGAQQVLVNCYSGIWPHEARLQCSTHSQDVLLLGQQR